MSRETNMTVGRPTKLILGLAVPLILTNVGQQLYTVADASIVGRGVGVEALAALGATDWLYWLVLWTVQAMTQGFSVLVSQTFGSNDKKGLRKAITMSVLLCAAVGILLTVVFVSSAGWLLHLLDTPENIYDGAHIYLTMMYAGTLITMAYNMAAAIDPPRTRRRQKSAYCHVYCRMSEHCARPAVRYPLRLGHSGRCRRDTARAAVCIRVLRHCAAENPGCVRRKAGLAAGQQCDQLSAYR